MKAYLAIFLSMFTALTIRAQSDSLGLPGDDLNLCGVLELFKTSKSPDEFEKALNKKDNKINNLDLNEDGKVDYLRVIDNAKDDAHAIIIRAVVSKTESQDVAVIEIEKKGDKNAQLQIVGDEELYGKDYIIEPKTEKAATENKWQGFAPQFVIVNVWYWPCVSYLWYPGYALWVSPWYWGYYPSWWYPWAPMPYYMYYQHVYVYHDYYYWTDSYRMTQAHSVYQPRRVVSNSVRERNAPAHQRAAERAKAAPRKAGGQQPVPGKRPSTPAPRQGQDDAYPDPAPRKGQDASPAPRQGQDASPAPKQEGKDPAPRPRKGQEASPKPPRADNPSPRPQRRPDVHTPSPRPSPAPRPQSPRPHSPRPR
jgi:hypothetical protein